MRKSDPYPKASQDLRGIIHVIDASRGKPTAIMMQNIRSLAIDALAEIENPDPRAQKLAMIVLVLRQCTSVTPKTVFGKPRLVHHITDREGFEWAIEQVHKLGTS